MNLSDRAIEQFSQDEDADKAALAAEVTRLRDGIRAHMQATGHELCWINDLTLWQLIDPEAGYPHRTLPVREEFLGQCARFYESRLKGTPYEEPEPRRTVTD
ncbi:MAG: hypothetical protein ABWY00_12375 [Dongiaceae bacterium]